MADYSYSTSLLDSDWNVIARPAPAAGVLVAGRPEQRLTCEVRPLQADLATPSADHRELDAARHLTSYVVLLHNLRGRLHPGRTAGAGIMRQAALEIACADAAAALRAMLAVHGVWPAVTVIGPPPIAVLERLETLIADGNRLPLFWGMREET